LKQARSADVLLINQSRFVLRQIKWFLALEDATGINAGLMICVTDAGRVAKLVSISDGDSDRLFAGVL
jgi:hypothetical protein